MRWGGGARWSSASGDRGGGHGGDTGGTREGHGVEKYKHGGRGGTEPGWSRRGRSGRGVRAFPGHSRTFPIIPGVRGIPGVPEDARGTPGSGILEDSQGWIRDAGGCPRHAGSRIQENSRGVMDPGCRGKLQAHQEDAGGFPEHPQRRDPGGFPRDAGCCRRMLRPRRRDARGFPRHAGAGMPEHAPNIPGCPEHSRIPEARWSRDAGGHPRQAGAAMPEHSRAFPGCRSSSGERGHSGDALEPAGAGGSDARRAPGRDRKSVV